MFIEFWTSGSGLFIFFMFWARNPGMIEHPQGDDGIHSNSGSKIATSSWTGRSVWDRITFEWTIAG